MLPTEKRFVSKLPTENFDCLSLPTKVGFFEKLHRRAEKAWGYSHIKKSHSNIPVV